MNELVGVAAYPQDRFPTSSLSYARDYFDSIPQEDLTRLWTQRNLAQDQEIARARFIARRRFA